MQRRENIIGNIDWLTVFLYAILVFFGWLSIYSASSDETGRSVFDLSVRYGKQLLWIAMAVVLAMIILIIDAKFFSTFAFWIYFLFIFTLIAVLLFGKTVAGSRSWFQIGSFAIQPAEFAKFATALALARYLSLLNIDMRSLKTKIIATTIILLPALLIFMQNDTGSALVYFAFAVVLYREGLSGAIFIIGLIMALLFITTLLFSKLYVLAALVVIILSGLVLFKRIRKSWKLTVLVFTIAAAFVLSVNFAFEHVLEPHQKTRINVLLGIEKDPRGAGYNVNQSMIAIGSGGLTGKGFRKGMLTQYQFVPEQSTDFIFCTVGEEWGFAGVLVVILLFITLIVRIVLLAERQRSKFSRIYGYGVASILFFHFAVNIGMTTGLAPVVGIPLPFFSYGGSSLWAFTILLFIFIKQDANRLNVL
ncbi:MAG TPA: rod shape-determining protein RodA [Bacteroidetes bacterium]|nr:rod shape-determining protein RodA [Bacteroidota bacterium]